MAHFFKKTSLYLYNILFCKWATWPLFRLLSAFFKQTSTIQFLQKIKVKNVHPKYGAGIQTHNLQMQVSSHNHWTRAPAQDQGSLQFS